MTVAVLEILRARVFHASSLSIHKTFDVSPQRKTAELQVELATGVVHAPAAECGFKVHAAVSGQQAAVTPSCGSQKTCACCGLSSHKGQTSFTSCITLSPSEDGQQLPVKLMRRLFPVRPAFAMTINRAQGQTLLRVGLSHSASSHGQLYVALSRVGSAAQATVLALGLNIDDSGVCQERQPHGELPCLSEAFAAGWALCCRSSCMLGALGACALRRHHAGGAVPGAVVSACWGPCSPCGAGVWVPRLLEASLTYALLLALRGRFSGGRPGLARSSSAPSGRSGQ